MLAKMANPKQPHIYGAAPLHYRQGTAVATTEAPPTWSPEQAADSVYPYTLKEYSRDIQRWMAATKVSADRQGPLVALAIGGVGRVVADELPDDILTHGAVMDLGDGLGNVRRTGVKLLLYALSRRFPDNPEATMIRTVLEFLEFALFRQANPPRWFFFGLTRC